MEPQQASNITLIVMVSTCTIVMILYLLTEFITSKFIFEYLYSYWLKFVDMKEEINKNKEYNGNSSSDGYYIAAEKELEEFLKQNNV